MAQMKFLSKMIYNTNLREECGMTVKDLQILLLKDVSNKPSVTIIFIYLFTVIYIAHFP